MTLQCLFLRKVKFEWNNRSGILGGLLKPQRSSLRYLNKEVSFLDAIQGRALPLQQEGRQMVPETEDVLWINRMEEGKAGASFRAGRWVSRGRVFTTANGAPQPGASWLKWAGKGSLTSLGWCCLRSGCQVMPTLSSESATGRWKVLFADLHLLGTERWGLRQGGRKPDFKGRLLRF